MTNVTLSAASIVFIDFAVSGNENPAFEARVPADVASAVVSDDAAG